ncbi:terminase [Salmonella enterica subsp. enterica]|nr:terminase [Salmonella enterica subsp. enterica]
MKYSDELRGMAKALYLKGLTPKEIAAQLNLPSARIIYHWADVGEWRDQMKVVNIEDAIARRIALLTDREKKTPGELDELDRLIGHHVKLLTSRNKHAERMAEIDARGPGNTPRAAAADDSDAPRQKKRRANDVSHLAEADFERFLSTLFGYQQHLHENLSQKIRNILKSRQIGATYYFAFEAFENATLTGDPQIFLSASKRQSEVFRSYIVNIALQEFGITLKGNPIKLNTAHGIAELHFLATNSNTAQSNSGHVYIDEYFWIPKFNRLNDVASAMATHDRWRLTYFSTPSAKTHEAYPFWTGETWKGGNKKRRAAVFPTFDEMRDGGRLCPDKQWRYVITLEDAIAGGFNLANIDDLRDRYSETAFAMLFMCQFVDDKNSVFRFSDVVRCGVETSKWKDYHPGSAHPYNGEVWGGFDPARTGDNATFVIVAIPSTLAEMFRVLEKYHWRGLSFQYMADQIEKLFRQFNMTFIGVDVTGIGYGVFELIQNFARRQAVAIRYNVETKTQLVLKMIDVIENQRIEWDAQEKDIAASFMSVKKATTQSGDNLTFIADRSAEHGHADVFFAISHALSNEPLNWKNKRKSTWAV